MKLIDVDPAVRGRAALAVIEADLAVLSADDRAELLGQALWPLHPDREVPDQLPGRKYANALPDERRREAIEMRLAGAGEAEVAERYGIARTTLRGWVGHARRRAEVAA